MKSRAAEILAQAAEAASIAEVMTTPKPGLVDACGNGCHNDMDCALFIKSAKAIAPFWKLQAETGLALTAPGEAMTALRRVGLEMERAMTEATAGINTHKGLIYLMSLLLYGAGRAEAEGNGKDAAAAAANAAEAAHGAVERELVPLLKKGSSDRAATSGEKLFASHGVTGVRGEAERGFPSVVKCGLPEFRRALSLGASRNDAGISALLEMMLVCEDSNVMRRGGYSFWRSEYPKLVRAAAEGFRNPFGNYGAILALEESFLPLRISPGGAADLLSCVYFLDFFSSKDSLFVVKRN